MKLLLFSDLHLDQAAACSLVERSQNVDVVVGAGDLANARRGLEGIVAILKGIECPAVLVPGNNESDEELRRACKGWDNAHVLHGSGVQVNGIEFFGLGGGVPPTPFGSWSFDLSEEQAALLLRGCPCHGVLVSHSPPRQAVDRSSSGQSLGSVEVRAIIEARQPALVVCGHVHASAGMQARVGRTPVVNAGPSGIEWTLG